MKAYYRTHKFQGTHEEYNEWRTLLCASKISKEITEALENDKIYIIKDHDGTSMLFPHNDEVKWVIKLYDKDDGSPSEKWSHYNSTKEEIKQFKTIIKLKNL